MSLALKLQHDFSGFSLDVAFDVGSGVTALFGASGAGKTSIIHAIAGLWRAERGRIVLNGKTVFDSESRVFVPPHHRRTPCVFQDARLFPHMTVEQNLVYGWRRAGRRATQEDILKLVRLLGIENLMARRPQNLSGGERSRVALGRAFLAAPEILLLDEPLAALDAARKAEIIPYLERLRDVLRIPMLYVSHSLDETARLADHMIVLRSGRVVAQGEIFDLMTGGVDEITAAGPGAVIQATIDRHVPEDGLSFLSFDGGILAVKQLHRSAGDTVRVRIRGADVMLALNAVTDVSANNILRCRVISIADCGPSDVDVQLLCGRSRLVARITRASARRLALRPDMPVYAVVKSVTVDAGSV